MTLSAHDVAAVLRDRQPGLLVKKLHKQLYYCQGHHLAAFDEPLFSETISAWDMGPVVGTLWYDEKQGNIPTARHELDEAALNTIGYVLSRYGALTGQDLENLTHSEEPWRLADSGRRVGESARIHLDWIKRYFRANGSANEGETPLDSAAVTEFLRGAEERRREPGRTDDPEAIQARIDEMRAKLAARA
ncbi:MAG: Panacea domain-containing protein [Pseudonocardiaceae bacterium]